MGRRLKVKGFGGLGHLLLKRVNHAQHLVTSEQRDVIGKRLARRNLLGALALGELIHDG